MSNGLNDRTVIKAGAWVEYNKAVKRYRVCYTNLTGIDQVYSKRQRAMIVRGGYIPSLMCKVSYRWKWVAKRRADKINMQLYITQLNTPRNIWVKCVD